MTNNAIASTQKIGEGDAFLFFYDIIYFPINKWYIFFV